jgi:hypothetical protein
MELKPGHHETEAGVIPEDWEVMQIGDLKPFVTSGSRGWAAYYSDQGSPFIRITNLSRSSIYLDLEDLRFVDLPANDSEGARTQLQDGDVLISITADIGIIGYVSSKVVPTENSESSEKSGVLRITALVSPACLRSSSDPSSRLLPADSVVGQL